MSIGFILPSVFPKWFTPSGDAVLAGGSLEFYDVGTTTPKSVYADYQRISAIGNVVTLNGAGDATIFLGLGGYKVILKDGLGAQLDLVDGIFGTGGSAAVDSNATYGFFKTYNDLRAISTAIDTAYVAGRDEEGDGGEGMFQLQPGVVAHDDDGIFLAAAGGSLEYKRIFDSSINPEWYGVRYAVSVDQEVALLRALNASAVVNFPVVASDRVFLAQNVLVPVGASVVVVQGAYFHATASVSLTFQAGTRFNGHGVSFSGAVQPIFEAGTVDAIRLSWMGGVGAEKWTRLLASTVATIPVLMDESTTMTSDLTVPANMPIERANGAIVTFDGQANLSIGALNNYSSDHFVTFTVDTYVGSVYVGGVPAKPEWFGAIGDGIADDSIPLYIAAKTGLIFLSHGKVYRQDTAWPLIPAILKMEGLGSFHLGAGITLGNGYLFLHDCKIFQDEPGTWFNGVYLQAYDAFFPSTFTATDRFCSGCTYTDDYRAPMFDGNPALKNAHLPLITSAQFLGTDADGKIIEGIKDISLDSLNVIRLILASLSSNSSHIDVSSFGITLENPLPLFCAVNSLFTHNTITLPIPVKSDKDPNLVFFFRRGLYDGSDFKLHSQHGNFSRTGTADSEEWSDYMIAYYDFDGPGWVTFGSH